MIEKPKISIVTPTYNSEQYLEQCILSIKNQISDNYEHIIVDGGSTDNTLDIIRKYEGTYPMKWISEPDEGMYDAINKGFRMASGEIYAWINSDDFYFPWTLEVVAKAFSQKDIQWLSGIPSNTQKLGGTEITYLLPNMPTVYNTKMIEKGVYDGQRMYFVQQESCFWTRQLWDRVGGVDVQYKMAGDYYLWRNFATHTQLYTINCNLASFRIHEEQKSSNIDKYYMETKRYKSNAVYTILIQVFLHLYSLCNYSRYVLNLLELYDKSDDKNVR